MHDLSFLVPIGIVSAIMARGAFTTWVKAKHGLPLDDRQSRRERRWQERSGYQPNDLDAERQVRLLSDENEKLVGKIGRLEERLAVLERIATDPAERTAREIDALRDR